MKKLAFIAPWYAENIPGGAESELRGLVHHLKDAGVDLEVLTTCVREFTADWWTNHYPEGVEDCAGIPVRRFPVRKGDKHAFEVVASGLVNGIAMNPAQEETYEREMVNSDELYKYIREHKDDYALFIFIPYLYGPTYYGVQECYDKAVMIPCFHDEVYIYMTIFRKVFPKIKGMIFHSEPERLLAERVFGVSGESFVTLGEGIDTELRGDAARFRDKYRIQDSFILYAGRKDEGKKVDELIRFFTDYKRRSGSDMKLILLGGGDIEIPDRDVIDLGYVPVQDKHDAYAAAEVFCNPSQFESFSIVMMESWLNGTPVLVNEKCAVTTDFVRRVGGGLYYNGMREFEAELRYLRSNPGIAREMGKKGRQYVLDNFSWDIIVERYLKYFELLGTKSP